MRGLILGWIIFWATAAFGQTALDRGVFDEMNLARTDPKRYAVIVKDARPNFSGKRLSIEGRIFQTNEGISAVDEAIAFLKKQKPLPPLEWSEPLRRAAADHVSNQGPTKQTGHAGTDGSTTRKRIERYGAWEKSIGENISYGFSDPRWVVIQLIIDDGVPKRGHRANIFSSAFKSTGVACGPHADFGSMCVIDFAGGISAK